MLGGVARRTRETILLCEAAGYDVVLVETVGVGQSELDVDGMTDLNVLLTIAGAGDDLQGIKRGIMESADVIVITKANSVEAKALAHARHGFANAIPFLPARDSGRRPTVLVTDALEGLGIPTLWEHLWQLYTNDSECGYLQHRRTEQEVRWMEQSIDEGLRSLLMSRTGMSELIAAQKEAVRTGSTHALKAASEVLMRFRTGA